MNVKISNAWKEFFQGLEKRSRSFPMFGKIPTSLALIALLSLSARAGYVTIGGTSVGADPATGYGSVNYSYQISQYEVTGSEFATAIADDSRIGDYSSDAPNAPAYYVSWYEAAKYCNWVTSGDAYSGAYQFDGTGTFLGIDRTAAIATYGTVYVLPTEDEWYKAAYWRDDINDQWSLYAHGADTDPTHGTTDGWNYFDDDFAYGHDTWPAGYGAQEQNGTYDIMGNVWEWMQTSYGISEGVIRGGSYGRSKAKMSSVVRGGGAFLDEYSDVGFRVAVIPEPSTVLLFSIGSVGTWLLRRNRIRNQRTG